MPNCIHNIWYKGMDSKKKQICELYDCYPHFTVVILSFAQLWDLSGKRLENPAAAAGQQQTKCT